MCEYFYSVLTVIICDWAMKKLRLNVIGQERNGIAIRVAPYAGSDFEGRNQHDSAKNMSVLLCNTRCPKSQTLGHLVG